MLEPETISFLEGGCAVIVGTVGDDGAPHASRGWGLTVVSAERAEVRLLLDADDRVAAANLAANGRVAVTGGDIRTLRSIQLKGEGTAVVVAAHDDRERASRYTDDFFGNINAVDGTPLELLNGLRVRDYVASMVRIAEMYDQTPGPAAGSRISGPTP